MSGALSVGGALGPRMFDHHVCRGGSFGFNGTSGESNHKKVITYTIVVNLLVFALPAVFWTSR